MRKGIDNRTMIIIGLAKQGHFIGESVKNTLSETLKITIAVSVVFNHLNLVVAAFGETVGVRNFK